MKENEKNIYVNKFNTVIRNSINLAPDRTVEIVTIDTVESIIKNEDIFQKFLDYENNLDFFNSSLDGLIDFISCINSYASYMFENCYEFSEEELERIQIITGKVPEKSSTSNNDTKRNLSDVVLHILDDNSLVEKLFQMQEYEYFDNFSKSEIKSFILESRVLKELIESRCLPYEAERNYEFIHRLAEIEKSYYRVSNNMRVEPNFEKEVFSQIEFSEEKFDLTYSIYDALTKAIVISENKEALSANWKELMAYFLEKNGIIAYVKKSDTDNEKKDVQVFLENNFIMEISKPAELDEKSRQEAFKSQLSRIEEISYRISPDVIVNPDLEKAVMENVQISDNKVIYAFNIYDELNKRLTFSSTMIALKQDLENPIIRSIYFQDISKYDEDNNRVTCRNWSELYAYFLEKYIGENAYINKKGKHKNVKFAIDDIIITADATNSIFSELDKTDFTDLTRAKLGFAPAGFKTNFYVPELDKRIREYNILDVDKINSEYSEYKEKSNVQELVNLLGSENLTNRMLNLDNGKEIDNILRKLKFISDIISNSNMQNMDNFKYLQVLRKNILSKEELNRVSVVRKLHTNIDENLDCELLPVISINIANSTEEPKYLYLMHNKEKGLCRITKEGILDIVGMNRLQVIKDNGWILPGIEELESNEKLNKHRMDMTIRSTSRKQLELKEDNQKIQEELGEEK